MPSVLLRQPAKSRSIEVHGENIPLAVVPLIRDEVNRILVYRLDRQNFVVSLFKLPVQLRLCAQRILLVEAV